MYFSRYSTKRLIFSFIIAITVVALVGYGSYRFFPRRLPKWWPRWLGGRSSSSKHTSKSSSYSSSASSSSSSYTPKHKPKHGGLKKKHHHKRGLSDKDYRLDLEKLQRSLRKETIKSIDHLQDSLNEQNLKGILRNPPLTRKKGHKKKRWTVASSSSFSDDSSTTTTTVTSSSSSLETLKSKTKLEYTNRQVYSGRRMYKWVNEFHERIKKLVRRYGKVVGREYLENIHLFWSDIKSKAPIEFREKQKKLIAEQINVSAAKLLKTYIDTHEKKLASAAQNNDEESTSATESEEVAEKTKKIVKKPPQKLRRRTRRKASTKSLTGKKRHSKRSKKVTITASRPKKSASPKQNTKITAPKKFKLTPKERSQMMQIINPNVKTRKKIDADDCYVDERGVYHLPPVNQRPNSVSPKRQLFR